MLPPATAKNTFIESWCLKILQEDSYFSQSLVIEASRLERLRGVWITQGRLGQLIGPKEAQLAIEEEWWATKPGKGS